MGSGSSRGEGSGEDLTASTWTRVHGVVRIRGDLDPIKRVAGARETVPAMVRRPELGSGPRIRFPGGTGAKSGGCD